GLLIRPAATGLLAKPKGAKKKPPKWVSVGKGKTSIPGGKSRKVALHLNKVGVALLKQNGKATIRVTLKTKSSGLAGVTTSSHTIHVVFKKKRGR
ncbi:MAG TPA: hypothetical protein VFS26_10095, partial [Solirubrobacterales bacterium]|nr:hypothetical protein [Solirubrobacterales bacterium]